MCFSSILLSQPRFCFVFVNSVLQHAELQLTCFWTDLGLGALVDRATSRSVSRGDCEFRKSFGSLSADKWVCVPALLVVWPEASQRWNLQVFIGARSWCKNAGLLIPPPPVFLSISES